MEEKHAKMIERIYSEVVGDEYTEGLIPKFQRIEKKVNRHDFLISVVIGLFVVIASIVAFVKDVFDVFK